MDIITSMSASWYEASAKNPFVILSGAKDFAFSRIYSVCQKYFPMAASF
jgi:hypothetical protein